MIGSVVLTTMRSARDLVEQIKTVESFLSDGRTDEDALATCSPGWRPKKWDPDAGPCVREDCTEDHSPHPRETQRWQAEIDRAVDRWPRHVVVGVPRAVNAMPLLDRLIIRGVLVMGVGRTVRATRFTNWTKVGEYAGCHRDTAKDHYGPAIEVVARACWTDEGEPIW